MPKPSCLRCDSCRQIPISRAESIKGVKPLLRCQNKKFDLIDQHDPRLHKLASDCEFFYDSETVNLEEVKNTTENPKVRGPRPEFIKADSVFSEEELQKIYDRVGDGPLQVYIPKKGGRSGSRRQQVLEAHLVGGISIRQIARTFSMSRTTVRKYVRENREQE